MCYQYIIVGAGCFGASTALHLARSYPDSQILLLGREACFVPGASNDLNKIVRDVYGSPFYSELAREASAGWKSDDFSSFYHQSGWVMLRADADSEVPNENSGSEKLEPQELRDRFSGVFKDSDLVGVKDIKWNEAVAWVDAERALEQTIRLAREAGATYRTAEISGLCWDGMRCSGVFLKDGEQIFGQSVVLAMGVWTAAFTAEHLQTQVPPDIFVNAGVSVATLTLSQSEIDTYLHMPIIAHCRLGEIIPPNNDGHIKITNARSFTNAELATSGPPKTTDRTSFLFEENRSLLRRFLPELSEREFSIKWYCYDSMTPDQEFLISNIPNAPGVFLATGGSFHGFKFLPIIGKYVIKMMQGVLEPAVRERWGLNRQAGGNPIHGDLLPERTIGCNALEGPGTGNANEVTQFFVGGK